jgi:SAM-dependent methyltransferase
MSSMYVNGEYAKKHPTWHVEDSPWKARHVIKILRRNSLSPTSIAEVGCGAGEVIRRVSLAFPNARCKGFEISPDALNHTRGRETQNLTYHLADVLQTTERFDLVLLIDVIEHIENCFGFLRSLRKNAKNIVAHLPLDPSFLSLLIDPPLATRLSVGHLHYFTRSTALALLSDTGYTVSDWFYPKGAHLLPQRDWRTGLVGAFRTLGERIAPGVNAIALGGASLMVLAH